VAVKVQYPGVAEAIGADLANTELLTTLLKLAQSTLPRMPQVDARSLAAELGARLTEELDYAQERRNIDEFAAIYANDPAIRIPRTFPALSTDRVLTMERSDGLSWTEALHAAPPLRDAWGEAINRFFFQSIYRHGLFHADPHPGNYVFHEDGTVTILDFGCVNRFDAETLIGFVAVAEATVQGDAERLKEEFQRYGFLAADAPEAEALLAFYRPTFEALTAPQPYRMGSTFAASRLNQLNPYGADGDIARQFNLPPKLVLTMRIYVGLFSVLAALEASADWRASFDEDVRYFHEHVEPTALRT
jgi:predicted unusual protein kinase regulating ubiquinone biosynthesis (AarF/ABC1/UbiB family)